VSRSGGPHSAGRKPCRAAPTAPVPTRLRPAGSTPCPTACIPRRRRLRYCSSGPPTMSTRRTHRLAKGDDRCGRPQAATSYALPSAVLQFAEFLLIYATKIDAAVECEILVEADGVNPATTNSGDYRRMPLLAFLSRMATSKACIWPSLRWMTETKSECCTVAILMPPTNRLITL
jgi:hypothetical protein